MLKKPDSDRGIDEKSWNTLAEMLLSEVDRVRQ